MSTKLVSSLAERGAKSVVLVPQKKLDFFKREYDVAGATFEGVDFKIDWRDKFLKYLSLAAVQTNSLKLKRSTEMTGRGALLASIFGGSFLFQKFVRFLGRCLTAQPLLQQQRLGFNVFFDKYKPDTVFVTDIQNEYDVRLAEEARGRRIKVVGMVRSWDNLTTKGLIRFLPDKLLVQNEIAKEEAVCLHRIPIKSIEIVGIPHYDSYFQALGNQIAKSMKLALFAPTGDRYIKNNTVDRDILYLLDKALDENWQILVRLPPTDSVAFLDEMKSNDRFIFDRPGATFKTHKNAELSLEDDRRLAETLLQCDLIVSGPSTIAIDAAFFDKPVILIAFDGFENRSYLQSVGRYYDYEHWRPVVESEAAKIARSQAEFSAAIDAYVKNPTLDKEARRKLAERFCFKVDGRSTERLKNVILNML